LAPKVLFHYPGIIQNNFNSGEGKRPFKMLNAFKEISDQVTEITGSYAERSEKWDEVKSSLSSFDCIYSENSNLPLAVCNEKKLPKLKTCDFQLFKEAKKSKVPIGVFVRDLYWAMKGQKQNPTIKNFIALPFYKSEMKLYNKYASKIFVPTASFAPFQNILEQSKIGVLPPGCDFSTSAKSLASKNLLYVGSCLPPTYDITKLLNEIDQHKLSLNIVTREKDHNYLNNNFNFQKNVHIQQANGNELEPIYKNTNFFLMLIEKTPYRELAMPLKVLESISFNCPIIAYDYGETAKLIKENNLGWVIQEANQLNELIEKITDGQYAEISNNLFKYAQENTWKDRANQILNELVS